MDPDELEAGHSEAAPNKFLPFLPEPGDLYSYLGEGNEETLIRYLCEDGAYVWMMEV